VGTSFGERKGRRRWPVSLHHRKPWEASRGGDDWNWAATTLMQEEDEREIVPSGLAIGPKAESCWAGWELKIKTKNKNRTGLLGESGGNAIWANMKNRNTFGVHSL
jgi:hypothetical protein